MTNRRILCATLCVGLLIGWAVPSIAQGAQCNTDENIVDIHMRGGMSGPRGMSHGLTTPLQVLGHNSAGKLFDITRCVTWEESTPDIVTRIDGGPTGSLLQSGAPTDVLTDQVHVGRIDAIFKNNEGKVLRTYKMVSVSFGGTVPLTPLLAKADPLPVAAPPPIQAASGEGSTGDAGLGIDPLLLGVGVAAVVGLGAIALSGLDFGGGGGSSCPANPCASTIDASCSCSPCSFFLSSCYPGGPVGDCKQCSATP